VFYCKGLMLKVRMNWNRKVSIFSFNNNNNNNDLRKEEEAVSTYILTCYLLL